ncbi:PREDICTED: leucine-rich repeat-containing protein 26 [Papilio polytes]|uniref:leucine-rich repeat-containing protein 26 n=1 Tax=Papilio polytes TaxID=76194 RepID=UPI000676A10E|nr:PREDICTED: leucine-rich repeat-containing protein 26 [Papilio polytes]
MGLILFIIIAYIAACAGESVCPKQCDCDMENELNRATCVDQNIVSVGVGVPKEVQVYSLSHNVLSELDNFCFKDLGYTSIQILNLSYNLIFWIGLHAFAGLDNLVYLDLSSNRLRYIPGDLFWDTPHLDTLDLSGNVFESLKNEPFLMHTNLQILNLNNCRIKSLPDRLFTRLPNLKKIDLSENYMISINVDILRPLRKLDRIELRNEYWQCNPSFIAVESWIVSRGITYTRQCKKKLPKMSEKMISIVTETREPVDINRVWNITKNVTEQTLSPTTPLTPFKKFDKEFSAFQAFVIGLEVGLAIGVVGTYIWLRQFCKCGNLFCSRNDRQRRRTRRHNDNDLRANLLWNNILNPNLETPPQYRRQLSLPEREVPNGGQRVRETALQADAIRVPNRSETPPPPYSECRINI